MQCCNLSGKTAIVTGASKGIGKSIAIKLALCGAKIALIARNKENLDLVRNTIINSGGEAQSFVGDVTNFESFSTIVSQTIKNWQKIDILINNAGITKDNIILRMSEEEWQNVIDTNLKGCFNGIKSITRHMMKNKNGRIINISSVIGQIGNAGQSNYAASKAGIIGLTKSLSKELGSRNININAINPGFIKTKMTENLETDKNIEFLNKIPLNRFGTVDEVSNLAYFLASNDSDYITGQSINIDGGMVV